MFASKQPVNIPVPAAAATAATAKNAFSLTACMSVSKEKLEQLPAAENKKNKLTVSFSFIYN